MATKRETADYTVFFSVLGHKKFIHKILAKSESVHFRPLFKMFWCSQRNALKTLRSGKASGPEGMSDRILRELAYELSPPLCSLFNESLHTGRLPTSYKEANVCPVPEKGDLSIVSNFRPISCLIQ